MANYLLDANLSPKVGRFLRDQCGLDVVSLHGLGLGELPDTAVIRMARDQQRIIVTLDRDFAEYFYRTREPNIGIIYLNLPTAQRFIGTINTVLQDFFTHHAGTIDLEHCLVIIDESTIQIVHPSGAPEPTA